MGCGVLKSSKGINKGSQLIEGHPVLPTRYQMVWEPFGNRSGTESGILSPVPNWQLSTSEVLAVSLTWCLRY